MTIESNSMTAQALNIMNENKIQCLFVCDTSTTQKEPIGLIRVLDLLRIGTA
jgi:predicted transcriptional regulator